MEGVCLRHLNKSGVTRQLTTDIHRLTKPPTPIKHHHLTIETTIIRMQSTIVSRVKFWIDSTPPHQKCQNSSRLLCTQSYLSTSFLCNLYYNRCILILILLYYLAYYEGHKNPTLLVFWREEKASWRSRLKTLGLNYGWRVFFLCVLFFLRKLCIGPKIEI